MTSSLRAVTMVLCVAILVSATSAASYGHFSDSEAATGQISAANSFGGGGGGGNTGPSGKRAYNDANGNGQYEQGESSYKVKDLVNFDDSSVDLVIPSDVKEVKENGNVQITANSVTSGADITAKNGNLDLNATGGGLSLDGTTLKSTTGTVGIDAADDVSLVDTRVQSDNGGVTVDSGGVLNLEGATIDTNHQIGLRAERISARNAVFDSQNDFIDLRSTNGPGELDATGATLSANGDITLRSSADIGADTATFDSMNGNAAVYLGSRSDSLFIDGTSITDRDDTLVYSPSNATVSGSPASGSVQAN